MRIKVNEPSEFKNFKVFNAQGSHWKQLLVKKRKESDAAAIAELSKARKRSKKHTHDADDGDHASSDSEEASEEEEVQDGVGELDEGQASKVGVREVKYEDVIRTPETKEKAGGFGVVSLDMLLGVQHVVLKEFKERNFKDMVHEMLYAIAISKGSTHVFAPVGYGLRNRGGHVYPFLLFPSGGTTLWQFVDKHHPSPALRRDICLQLLEAVKQMHALEIIHGDLKGNNVLVMEKPLGLQGVIVSLIDFSLTATADKTTSKYDNISEQETARRLRRAYWIAPETGNGIRMGKLSDMYSVGFLLLDVLIPQCASRNRGRNHVYEVKTSVETYSPYVHRDIAIHIMNCFGARSARPTADVLYEVFKDSEIRDGVIS
ncbi:hypothetical protein CYMTET_9428 [Cymbomonas tetramitiformis]|uniref:Protein kinase domain-containing protein n=1 Tax=Cymbomonas tetramitiformis TaxID=36881 RepID=A0AAE0GRI0_9CHLO|nr:hypothetical protein CYMTET_9428 [Cymbomonas tetramitiformis]